MAEWTTAYVNDLPDSAFACPEQRKYPHHDASGKLDLPHLRAALSRIGDPSNDQCGKAHLQAHARAEGMGEAKALLPIKAQLMDTDEMEAWFAGKLPRRILSIPFGGPIPSAKSKLGVDLDGEWFSQRTDIFGPYSELRQNRERLVDFNHAAMPPHSNTGDPTGVMSGVLIGKAVLDKEPDEEGWWSDFWFKVGERRVSLIKSLAAKGAQLFGSSQPIGRTKKDPETGEITVWPHFLQTISPAPQNTFSVIRPAKAMLDDLDDAEITVSPVVKALLADLEALSADLSATSDASDLPAKAGLDAVYAATGKTLDELLSVLR